MAAGYREWYASAESEEVEAKDNREAWALVVKENMF
jgi:hypothetical protein